MAESMEDYKEELEASFREIKEGDIISGVVLGVTEEEVTLDLKYYTQGVIKVEDLSNDPNFHVMEDVHPGMSSRARSSNLMMDKATFSCLRKRPMMCLPGRSYIHILRRRQNFP